MEFIFMSESKLLCYYILYLNGFIYKYYICLSILSNICNSIIISMNLSKRKFLDLVSLSLK